MKNLQKNISNPNPKILATWSLREANVIYAHCGYKSLGQPLIPEAKIKDYSDAKQFANLANELLTIQRYKGIRDLLGKTENERLVQFLRVEFSDLTIFEIWEAVDIAAAPENPFELKYNGRVNEFTNDWLTQILRPYRNYRAGLLNRYIEQEIELERGPVPEKKAEDKVALAKTADIKLFSHAWDAIKAGEPYAALDRVFKIIDHNQLYDINDPDVELAKKDAALKMRVEAKNGGVAASLHEMFVNAIDRGIAWHETEWQRIMARKIIKADEREKDKVLEILHQKLFS